MSSLVWLASFPKSGNTWLRSLFTHYLMKGDAPLDVNALLGENIADRRGIFDECMGVASADMPFERECALMPLFHELLARECAPGHLIKTHLAFQHAPNGEPFFSPKSSRCAIYLVRNPLDVAVSYAPFADVPIDRAIDILASPGMPVKIKVDRGSMSLPYIQDSWSRHVRGWTRQKEIPALVVRYEDLLADTETVFRNIVGFVGLEIDNARIRNAVQGCQFRELARKEREDGFYAFQSRGTFFRKGIAGDGLNTLSRDQVDSVVKAHAEVMDEFGYLPLRRDMDE